MARRVGLQTEVTAGLALVMGLATAVLTGVMVAHHEWGLRATLGRALLAEARERRPIGEEVFPGTDWWIVTAQGVARPRGPVSAPADEKVLDLAARAREQDSALLEPGAFWDEMRFAVVIDARGDVAAARLPKEASVALRWRPLAVTVSLAIGELLVFGLFGAVVLRRRVVAPLERLAEAARSIGEGAPGIRVEIEGPRETVQVAQSFNEMSESLAAREADLGKAVADLRATNEALRRARAGLARAERLAAVGRLAAGVAHEVGNPIGAILTFVELAARDPSTSQETREVLARTRREGERVRRILRQLLDFSRPSRPEPTRIDLGSIAEETVGLLSAQPRYAAIVFEWERDGTSSEAWGDPGAVGQILLNLLLNAADAVSGVAEPRIRLILRPTGLRQRTGDRTDGEARLRAAPDGFECLVADNGCGIPEADRERVFDPFFTTKPPGEGTGLGLANAARLAEELGGAVEIAKPPKGFATALALRLPADTPGKGAAVRRTS